MQFTKAAKPHTLLLPSIENIEAQFDAFAQKAGHLVDGLEGLAKIFYPAELQTKWVDALTRTVKKRNGPDSTFASYLDRVGPILLFVRDMRNLIEHPKPNEFIKVHNFRLLASGALELPSIEIVRLGKLTENNIATSFMKAITDHLVNACEAFFVYLCDSNIDAKGVAFTLRVIELPPDQRRNLEVRYSYGYYNGESMVPISVG
jgi:hypothetical protein